MPGSVPTILVVDDNPATRYSTSRVLRGAGWHVEEVGTGSEALAKAVEGVDLVVLDVNLPDIDGFTVCRTLREREDTARLPILHLSASFTSSDHKVTGLESGADGYLTHPVEPPVLIATVSAFLRNRQNEIELRQSEARFKAVFENALTGVALVDENLVYVDFNPKMTELLQRDREQMIGKSFEDFIAPGYFDTAAIVRQELRDNLSWHGTLPLVRPDGEYIFLEWHVSIHTDPHLRLAIVSDISDRIRYEAERESLLSSERAARTDAERANRLKDDFLATLSHELRTPLNAIVGWSTLLRMGKLSPSETEEGLEAIERNARAQSQMIADLLDVSRITSGKMRLNIDLLNLPDVVNAALSSIVPAANSKSIHLTKSIDAECGLIQGDASRLQQIIWNLVNNAVKFTPRDGHINVSLRKLESEVEICVSDDGLGISSELLPRIFERFHQGDSGSTRHYGGLGLGLAIVKQLVELHRGKIVATSAGADRGSQFTVTLPIFTAPVSSNFESSHASLSNAHKNNSVDLTGVRVLLVEDDADSRRMITRVISDRGAQVDAVSDVDQALRELTKFAPMIIVSDLGMPGRDGFELIREIRRMGYSAQTLPAIALTAFVQPEDRKRALTSGFQIHLSKPVDPHELSCAIASLLT